MDTKKPRNRVLEAVRVASLDELKAVEFLELHRWGDSPACPGGAADDEACRSTNVYKMRDAPSGARNKDFRWRCKDCKRMFTVRTKTILAETRLPLSTWLHCCWRATASKKGVSALQISREGRISYKSALHLMHRIREAMAFDSDRPRLTSTVEADETYVGGKPRNKELAFTNPRGAGTEKAPVIAVIQRGGEVRMRVAPGPISTADIRPAVHNNVD